MSMSSLCLDLLHVLINRSKRVLPRLKTTRVCKPLYTFSERFVRTLSEPSNSSSEVKKDHCSNRFVLLESPCIDISSDSPVGRVLFKKISYQDLWVVTVDSLGTVWFRLKNTLEPSWDLLYRKPLSKILKCCRDLCGRTWGGLTDRLVNPIKGFQPFNETAQSYSRVMYVSPALEYPMGVLI
jgi:hypothetical protein